MVRTLIIGRMIKSRVGSPVLLMLHELEVFDILIPKRVPGACCKSTSRDIGATRKRKSFIQNPPIRELIKTVGFWEKATGFYAIVYSLGVSGHVKA
jgi:hypothetical protein